MEKSPVNWSFSWSRKRASVETTAARRLRVLMRIVVPPSLDQPKRGQQGAAVGVRRPTRPEADEDGLDVVVPGHRLEPHASEVVELDVRVHLLQVRADEDGVE